jgi:cyclic pyranopterin phosphate synthase
MHSIKYLRVNITKQCNLRCFYCHNEGQDFSSKKAIFDTDILVQRIIHFINAGVKKVKFVGGEPSLVPELPEIIQRLRSQFPLIDLSMITNGTTLYSHYEKLIQAGLNRINVSIHGFHLDKFKFVTKGSEHQMNTTLKNIISLKTNGILGKVNYVLIKGTNEDEFFDVIRFANEHHLVVDVLNYLGMNDELIKKYRYEYDEVIQLVSSQFDIKDRFKHINPHSINSNRISLLQGAILNLKMNRLNDHQFLKSCSTCPVKKYCTEGIAAIRLNYDGIVQPCLIRQDNTQNLNDILSSDSINGQDWVNDYLNNL